MENNMACIVRIKTLSGWADTEEVADFTRTVMGEDIRFSVTRAIDGNGFVVTFPENGFKVCNVDALGVVLHGELESAKLSLENFIAKFGEKRFSALVLLVRGKS